LNPLERLAMRSTLKWFDLILAGLLLVLGAGVAEAQKTDSVWIKNGDRITGEVKALSHALLEYSTDNLGTIYIEWDKVDRISSPSTFEVTLSSGRKIYGTLGLSSSGKVVMGMEAVPLIDIVILAPIKQTFFERLDGYLDLGFSYQKAHQTVQLTTGAKVAYRGPGAETVLEFSTFLEDRDDAAETSRLSGSLTERLLFKNRWSAGVVVGYERNQELDLAGRTRIVGFGARTMAQNNHLDFWITGGLVGTLERYFSTDTTTTSVEGLAGLVFDAFKYDHPKLAASILSQVFPSFTIGGRVRWENNLRVSHELVKDFMVTATLFDSYDSKPPAAGASKNDFGTTLAISWTF